MWFISSPHFDRPSSNKAHPVTPKSQENTAPRSIYTQPTHLSTEPTTLAPPQPRDTKKNQPGVPTQWIKPARTVTAWELPFPRVRKNRSLGCIPRLGLDMGFGSEEPVRVCRWFVPGTDGRALSICMYVCVIGRYGR